jgi:pimeloyl-ACP methyl ester carboxylesterase
MRPREEVMQALFVHGMGRSPLSGLPLLVQLRRAGVLTSTFGYSVALEAFPEITARLAARVSALAEKGSYVVVGHSLGGVLVRAVLNSLPPAVRAPRRLFLLGSPVQPSRIAQKLGANPVYRVLAGDCGQLLGSTARMEGIPPLAVPTTAIVGRRGLPWPATVFAGEANDGVVAVSEASAEWIRDRVLVDCVHTLLPSSRRVGEIILERLAQGAGRAD